MLWEFSGVIIHGITRSKRGFMVKEDSLSNIYIIGNQSDTVIRIESSLSQRGLVWNGWRFSRYQHSFRIISSFIIYDFFMILPVILKPRWRYCAKRWNTILKVQTSVCKKRSGWRSNFTKWNQSDECGSQVKAKRGSPNSWKFHAIGELWSSRLKSSCFCVFRGIM